MGENFMQEKSRPISARVGALSATALLALSGTFIAGPAVADTTDETSAATNPVDSTATITAEEAAATPTETQTEEEAGGEDTGGEAPAPGDDTGNDDTGAPGTGNPPVSVPGDGGSVAPGQPAPAAELSRPALITTSPIRTSQAIEGTAPGATSLEVAFADQQPFTVPVASDGSFSFTAPHLVTDDQRLQFILTGINGNQRSEPATFSLDFLDAPLPAPVFTGTDGSTPTSLDTLLGTGVPGATITVIIQRDGSGTEDAPASTTVGEDGNWRLTLADPLPIGVHALAAVQRGVPDKEDSEPVQTTITVFPGAAVVLSPGDGERIPVNKLPAAITGAALPGAEIEVVIDPESDGAENRVAAMATLTTVADENGNWSVPLAALAVGEHQIVATQVYNNVRSLDAAPSTFTVTEAVVEPPVAVNPVPAGNSGQGGTITTTGNSGTGTGTGTGPGTGNNLAETGARNVGLLAAGGATLVAGGAAALFLNRRRRTVADS